MYLLILPTVLFATLFLPWSMVFGDQSMKQYLLKLSESLWIKWWLQNPHLRLVRGSQAPCASKSHQTGHIFAKILAHFVSAIRCEFLAQSLAHDSFGWINYQKECGRMPLYRSKNFKMCKHPTWELALKILTLWHLKFLPFSEFLLFLWCVSNHVCCRNSAWCGPYW